MKNYIIKTDLINAYIIKYESNVDFNRGYGCGYVEIKKEHPVYKLAKIEQLDSDNYFYFQLPLIGEEITFCEFKNDVLTIGFDTSHSYNTIENSPIERVKESTIKMFNQCKAYSFKDVEIAKNNKIEQLKKQLNKI